MSMQEHGFAHIALIIGAITLMGGTGTVVASNSARPGDLLYPVDQAMESVQGALTFGEANEAKMHARMAQERLGELKSLENGNAPQDRLDQAVRNYGESMEKALESGQKLEGESKQEVLGLITKQALVDQDVLLELSESTDESKQATYENAFQKANQYFGEAGEGLSEEKMAQVMEQAKVQVRNMDGLLEQIQAKTQSQTQENNPDNGTQAGEPENQAGGNNETGNQSEEAGNDNTQSGSSSASGAGSNN